MFKDTDSDNKVGGTCFQGVSTKLLGLDAGSFERWDRAEQKALLKSISGDLYTLISTNQKRENIFTLSILDVENPPAFQIDVQGAATSLSAISTDTGEIETPL